MVMVVVGCSCRRAPAGAADPRERSTAPRHDDQQARGEVEPRVELLGQDVLREGQRDEAEREDADRVRDRDDRPERHRVAGGAARAHQVGGDHRLAVAGRERVQRAPAERGEQEEQEHALAGGRALEDAGEAVAAAVGCSSSCCAAVGRRGGGQRPAPRRHGQVASALVVRAREQVLGVGAQAVRRVAAGSAGAHRGACPGPRHDRLPAHAAGEGAVVDAPTARGFAAAAPASGSLHARERGGRPGRGGRRCVAPAGGRSERRRPSTSRDTRAAQHLGALAREQLGGGEAALLEGRDLGLVEDVAQVDAVARDADLGQVVDREVAERVGAGGGAAARARERGEGRRPRASPRAALRPARRARAASSGESAGCRRARGQRPGRSARPRRAGDHAGVVEEQRVARAEPQRAVRPRQSGARVPERGQRPAERVGRAHARAPPPTRAARARPPSRGCRGWPRRARGRRRC